MARSRVTPSGFTLAEVMVALFLVALLGIAVANLDFFAEGVFHRSDRRLWANQEPRRLLDWMIEDVEQATDIQVHGGNPTDWTTPLAVGVSGNAVEIRYLVDDPADGITLLDRTDDDTWIIRYSWTTFDLVDPQTGANSLAGLIRRNRQVDPAGPPPPGLWNSGIVGGLTEDRIPGAPTPDTVIIAITNFQATKTTDPNTSNLNLDREPENVLQVDVTASRGTEDVRATYYLQSRALRAQNRSRHPLVAFLKRTFTQ